MNENKTVTSPWTLERLNEKLKAKGAPILAEGARAVVEALHEYVIEGIEQDDTKMNDFLLPVVESGNKFVIAKLDQLMPLEKEKPALEAPKAE